jgi:hypothetical protein
VSVQAERRAAERAGEEEFRRRMLERFAEEDRLEQMNMQAGAAEHDCLCSSRRCV